MIEPETIQVAIIEDDRRTREGLAALIGGTPGYRCVGLFAGVEDALLALPSPPPDVLLVDIHLTGMPGSEGVRPLRVRCPTAQVLMLTAYGNEDQILASICNGAAGYLLKTTAPAELLAAIRQAHEGGSPMSADIARKVVGLLRATKQGAAPEGDLTPQEVRLLKLLAEGHSYLSAGGQLNVSVNTVRNYIRSIYEKLQVHTRSEAVSKALRQRLIL
jgi:DNA-binding NarL/FixJ family response regulator